MYAFSSVLSICNYFVWLHFRVRVFYCWERSLLATHYFLGELQGESLLFFSGDEPNGAISMTEDHDALPQAAVRPVPHAGPGLHLLLFWEATSACMGPEAT